MVGGHLLSVLSVPLCSSNKHTHKHTHEAIELAHSLRWNKTVPSAENSTTEGKKPAVLIGIPSSWSSWIQTLSHSELTLGNGKKTREMESESDREHIFDCSQKADPTSPPPPPPPPPRLICSPQLPVRPHFDSEILYRRQNRESSEERGKKTSKEFEVLSFLNE